MTRRDFALAVSTAFSGMLAAHAAAQGTAGDKKAKDSCEGENVSAKHVCKGMNECKGQGGCQTADHDCAGKNECKGKGGCATVAHHDCAGKNECKGQGGCKTANHDCAGKNECKGKGGCAVPLKKAQSRLRLRRVMA